jgi:hypothetical protein
VVPQVTNRYLFHGPIVSRCETSFPLDEND